MRRPEGGLSGALGGIPGSTRDQERFGFAATAMIALLASMLSVEAEGQGGGLFSAVDPSAERARAPDPSDTITLRRRVVGIDCKML